LFKSNRKGRKAENKLRVFAVNHLSTTFTAIETPMNNLALRSITGIAFISLIIGSILWDRTAVVLVFGGFMLLGVHEFTRLINNHTQYSVQRWFTVIIAALGFAAFTSVFYGYLRPEFLFLLFPVALVSLVTSLFRESVTPLQNAAIGFFSWIYIAIPFIMIIHLAFAENNPWEMIGMFVVIWTNDTMAYTTGRLIGKTKLFERISPKKTWEGTIIPICRTSH
jgi:phosphatidate cytidylyltransferase